MHKHLRNFAFLFVAGTLSALASPVPIPDTMLGDHSVGNFTFPYLIGPFPGGYGGAFTIGIANGTHGGPYTTQATIWCVDYQLDVSSGSHYNASIVPLSQIQPLDYRVRYGDVTTANSSAAYHWVDNLGPNYTTAAERYALTAALITQYGPSPGQPTNSKRNQEIQEAIWEITQNTRYSSSVLWPKFSADPNVASWVNWAENNVDHIDLSKFALISGPIDAQGDVIDGHGNYQTFVTELTPEPREWGMLAIGLVLLAWKVRSRSRAVAE